MLDIDKQVDKYGTRTGGLYLYYDQVSDDVHRQGIHFIKSLVGNPVKWEVGLAVATKLEEVFK